eukprot:TRINITY_DN63970_c0_g1_i1.p1 TRINITY_DN63970_c0_g1~~TRINITY_DN63970_c0_g1_i1.p1  ORF type:complete len:222 (+),score=71.95 TRINITY_DN63970_c0_g1_i1:104-769(+)
MSPHPKIEALLRAGGRYDPAIIPQLEEFVNEQLAQATYDLDANLALLKLYLLHPKETKIEMIQSILLKALMAYPNTDFSLCMFQIPEKYHADLKEVVGLARQLEMAKFKSFWKESANNAALAKAKGWDNSVRDFIAGVVSNTYRSIKSNELLELLNLPAKDLDAMIKKQSWSRSKENKDLVVVNTSSFESVSVEPKKAAATQNLSFDSYKSLVKAAAATAA